MKADEAKKIADQALEQLSTALAQGKSASLTRYLAAMSRFHAYSWGNLFLILAQRPDATNVAGFQTWKALGRFVKKGEKGIAIIAPMNIRPREDEQQGAEAPARPVLRFKAVYVFDVTQTDGEPLPTFQRVAGDPGAFVQRLCSLIESHGIALVFDAPAMGADGVSSGGKILVKPDLAPAETFSVLAHEFAHELLHHRGERPASKTVRETEAEAVAFVVCQAIGLSTTTAASDYIQLYDGDKDTLAKSLDRIQRTAAEIVKAVMHPEGYQGAQRGE